MPARRTSNRMKVLTGTDRADRMHDEPDLPIAEEFEPPEWLSSPAARQEWDRLVGLLSPARILTEGDLSALGHLCNLHGACVKLYQAGMAPTAAQLTQLRLLLGEFGLTPASRSNAGVAEQKERGNPFLEALRGGSGDSDQGGSASDSPSDDLAERDAEIRRRHEDGDSYATIAADLGLSKSRVGQIVRSG